MTTTSGVGPGVNGSVFSYTFHISSASDTFCLEPVLLCFYRILSVKRKPRGGDCGFVLCTSVSGEGNQWQPSCIEATNFNEFELDCQLRSLDAVLAANKLKMQWFGNPFIPLSLYLDWWTLLGFFLVMSMLYILPSLNVSVSFGR